MTGKRYFIVPFLQLEERQRAEARNRKEKGVAWETKVSFAIVVCTQLTFGAFSGPSVTEKKYISSELNRFRIPTRRKQTSRPVSYVQEQPRS